MFDKVVRQGVGVLFVLLAAMSAALAQEAEPQALFRIAAEKVRPVPGAPAVTVSGLRGNQVMFPGGAFEPFVFRFQCRVTDTADNALVLPLTSPYAFACYKTGFWDGAEVRVYRIRQGKLVKVRESRVPKGGYVASGWLPVMDMFWNRIVHPKITRYSMNVSESFRPGQDYFFSVTALAKDGRESSRSRPVQIALAADQQHMRTKIHNRMCGLLPGKPHSKKIVPAPRELKATLKDGVLILNWQPVGIPDLAGYRVYMSEEPPAKHQGYRFALTPVKDKALQSVTPHDMIFVSHQVPDFSRQWVRDTAWNWGAFRNADAASAGSQPGDGVRLRRVVHTDKLPADFTHPGRSCLQINLAQDRSFSLSASYVIEETRPDRFTWHTNRSYRAEGWVRYKGSGLGMVQLHGVQGPNQVFEHQADKTWRRFRMIFSPPPSVREGRVEFRLTGPGVYWLDNLRVYPEVPGFLRPEPALLAQLTALQPTALRFALDRGPWGLSLDMLTDPAGLSGVGGPDGLAQPCSLPLMLELCRQAGAAPWIQAPIHFSEREWLGLLEYLAAPYDSSTDTAQSKPWAAKRVRQGRTKPWLDDFERVYLEIGCQTWNRRNEPWIFHHTYTEARRHYAFGKVYGLFADHVVAQLRSAPWLSDTAAAKLQPILGDQAQHGANRHSYGLQAVCGMRTPAMLMLEQAHDGWQTWLALDNVNPYKVSQLMTAWPRERERAMKPLMLREGLIAAGKIQPYKLGLSGAKPSLAPHAAHDIDRFCNAPLIGTSLAEGIAVLDAWLGRALMGFDLLDPVPFQPGAHPGSSHLPLLQNAAPRPTWRALAMAAPHVRGDFLAVDALSAPRLDDKGQPDSHAAPAIGVYATCQNKDVTLILINRAMVRTDKTDKGQPPAKALPVTIELPFTRAASVSLQAMWGDPLRSCFDQDGLKQETVPQIPFRTPFTLERATTGGMHNGLPPSSILVYRFTDTDIPALAPARTAKLLAPDPNVNPAALKVDGLIPALPVDPRIDGALDDWRGIDPRPAPWMKKETSSIYLGWTTNGLFGAAIVPGGQIQVNPAQPYLADCLELWLQKDAASLAKRNHHSAQYVFFPPPSKKPGHAIAIVPFGGFMDFIEDFRSAWTKSDDAFILEFHIPSASLYPARLEPGAKLRLNAASSNNGKPHEQLFYDKNKDQGWDNPSVWGVVELAPANKHAGQ